MIWCHLNLCFFHWPEGFVESEHVFVDALLCCDIIFKVNIVIFYTFMLLSVCLSQMFITNVEYCRFTFSCSNYSKEAILGSLLEKHDSFILPLESGEKFILIIIFSLVLSCFSLVQINIEAFFKIKK